MQKLLQKMYDISYDAFVIHSCCITHMVIKLGFKWTSFVVVVTGYICYQKDFLRKRCVCVYARNNNKCNNANT